ncbi:predicted protein [Postia placenta Mad-698-R]|nr:predicted protein [Postia placenta Mad-698-R]
MFLPLPMVIDGTLLSLVDRTLLSLADRTRTRAICPPPEATQSGFLKLNRDVLWVITSFLTPLEALSLSRTTPSGNVRDVARARAFSSLTVHKTNNYRHDFRKIKRVCEFLLDDIPDRVVHLRKLNLQINHGPDIESLDELRQQQDLKDATSRLTELLYFARGLQSIRLENFATLIGIEPRITDAIVTMPNLRDLDIYLLRDGKLVWEFLSRVRRNLRKLRIADLALPTRIRPNVYEIICAIKNIQIKTLELDGIVYSLPSKCATTLTFSLPSVHELLINQSRFSMALLVNAFPNLRVLRLGEPPMTADFGSWATIDFADAGSWPILDYAEGPSKFFDRWSPAFPIRCVSLTDELAGRITEPDASDRRERTLQLAERVGPRALEFATYIFSSTDPSAGCGSGPCVRYVRDTAFQVAKQVCPEGLAFPILVDPRPGPYLPPPEPDMMRFYDVCTDSGQAEYFWAPLVASVPELHFLNLTLRIPPRTNDLMAVLNPYMSRQKILCDAFKCLPRLTLVRLSVIYDTFQKDGSASWLPASITSKQARMLASTLVETSIRYVSLSFTAWRYRTNKGRATQEELVRSAAWKIFDRRGVKSLEPITQSHEEMVYKRIMDTGSDFTTNS